MLQIGYHARGGGAGFASHTYVPGLRLKVEDELISESHGRVWASRLPLIGIVGNDCHGASLGSLAGTPYLVVQRTVRNDLAAPVFGESEGLQAIREFAREALVNLAGVEPPDVPAGVTFRASMPNGADHAQSMLAAGWQQTGAVEYEAHLEQWAEARPLIAAGMNAALAPLMPFFFGARSAEDAGAADPEQVAALRRFAEGPWCAATHPDWYTEPADEIGVPGA